MNIKLSDHGRSIVDQLSAWGREKTESSKQDNLQSLQKSPATLKDIFEKSAAPKTEEAATKTAEDSEEASTGAVEGDGLNISFQFDLFYELSSKVEAKMGQSGANRFAEISGKVSETFMGSFNLSIDAVGSFMNGTDKSLDISPETTGEFFDAVEGLADLSPEALENFLKESDSFFNELEATYGEANGAFDDIKSMMQEQAKAFFADVEATRKQAVEGTETAAALPAAETAATTDEAAATTTEPSIKLLLQPETEASQGDYKDFLKDFLDYTTKFRQQMFEKLLGKFSGYDKMLKGADEDTSSNSLVDTAV